MTEYTKPALPEPGFHPFIHEHAYSSDQLQAHADACVAAYKAHVRAEQGEEDVLATYSRTDGRREWVNVGCWMRPGEEIVQRAAVSGAADPVGLPAGETTGPVSAAPTLTDGQIDAIPLDHIGLANGRHGGMETIALRKFARAVLAAAQPK